ncbi:MAG: glycosyltransferase family 2 protein [Elusimicrobia bacterium]|nr:glycosyltransferase family 2 protein [Elusimicrobiota bacterium]
MPATASSLSLIVPVYNEQDALPLFLDQLRQVRERLLKETDLSAVEILIVDDGSTDSSPEILKQFPQLRTLRHEKNRGYGAALKTGFEQASGEILGFLDADATCPPEEFARLYHALQKESADIVLGSRLNPQSRMPFLRRIGNYFYAWLLRFLTGRKITDAASGMRLFKKELLSKLYPLPDGLSFTPAMSARVLSDPSLTLCEVPISYQERWGKSKLKIWSDGWLFLKAILETFFSYSPLLPLGGLGLLYLFIAFGYGLYPIRTYWRTHRLEEDMIYRLLTIETLLVGAAILLFFGSIAQKASRRSLRRSTPSLLEKALDFFSMRWGAGTILAGVVLNTRPLSQYIRLGEIHEHWVYVLTGAILVLLGTTHLAYRISLRLVETIALPPPQSCGDPPPK